MKGCIILNANKNKFFIFKIGFDLLSAISIILILTIITLNFYINGHLHGQFEMGFHVESNQIYLLSFLIVLIILSSITSFLLGRFNNNN